MTYLHLGSETPKGFPLCKKPLISENYLGRVQGIRLGDEQA